jgi:hypothetical protein
MGSQKYAVNQHLIETLLAWIRSGEIAIPEIQRPFVWDATKVRDLMDSLYKGYPVGYIIAWKNPSVRLKDGTMSAGKKVLIDERAKQRGRESFLDSNFMRKPNGYNAACERHDIRCKQRDRSDLLNTFWTPCSR